MGRSRYEVVPRSRSMGGRERSERRRLLTPRIWPSMRRSVERREDPLAKVVVHGEDGAIETEQTFD
jgi:hypothetical protein